MVFEAWPEQLIRTEALLLLDPQAEVSLRRKARPVPLPLTEVVAGGSGLVQTNRPLPESSMQTGCRVFWVALGSLVRQR
jgi:hypothetical protein